MEICTKYTGLIKKKLWKVGLDMPCVGKLENIYQAVND